MPRETRTIVFSDHELHRAMIGFAARQKMPMPQGPLDGFAFDPEIDPALTLSVRPTAGAPVRQQVAFRKAEVAAALILLCRDMRIPLPKEGRKQLVCRDGCPAFTIDLD